MDNLGTMEELPKDYQDEMERTLVHPLWPLLRNTLPPHKPNSVTQSHNWAYKDVRPLLMRAGELTPVEKAERRVLMLSDPGRGAGAMQATATIYAGLQLLLPGERAPSHRHTPSAARIIVEGEGAYTVVDGERLPMEMGDVVLTPGGAWHDHGHDGAEPVIWLDALDLPLFARLEASYGEEGDFLAQRNRPDASQLEFAASGLLPTNRNAPEVEPKAKMLRYPWKRSEEALRNLAEHADEGEAIELDYVKPGTSDSCLAVLGFTATMLRKGDPVRQKVRSSSAVFHVVKGQGTSVIDGKTIEWSDKDTFSAPVFAEIDHEAAEDAFLIRIHDAPLQQKLEFYEERPRS
ncbi:Gentisate 1,2-dioxygenase [Sulfitobacter sp. DSM 110093]|uniref:cupin domain-containing protein n=1 Tax=Sulfitobacter sp. DSM 110093 TaxID=2883127 RepID=UPI001FAC2BB2|nr:cupin domain-containing protein [Sulfitobacter sp. DSM 110093]UOA33300.1 Gentisate 1,2-dioxygenase [Sulfitobacter sp. DSM 110093]